MQGPDIHTALDQKVLLTLLYFDIFNYPLKKSEIFEFLPQAGISNNDLEDCLGELLSENLIFRNGDFYSVQNENLIFIRRINGNLFAEKMRPVALSKAKVIAAFPFVRGVMASGSFSKGYMDEHADLDFFVVCAPGKLWIARTLLVIFKRIFYFNSHKYFCVNYFIASDNLRIEERNIFTATELATLIPLYNEMIYGSLMDENSWVLEYFPNLHRMKSSGAFPSPDSFLKPVLEWVLEPVSSLLDTLFMKVTLMRWKRIYANKYQDKDFAIAFKTRKGVSKNHPNNYQSRILELFNDRIKNFGIRHNISWQ